MTRDVLFLLPLFLLACGGEDTDTGGGGKDTTDDSSTDTNTTPVDAPDLVINEVLAANATINTDAAGEYDDWIEIYNSGDSIVQLDGLYFTDDEEDPQQYAFPTGRGLSPGDFLLVWCDGATDQETASELHTPFKLNKGGDTLFLYYFEGEQQVQVDAIQWTDTQIDDTSAARIPDGSLTWELTTNVTPAAANQSSN